MTNLDYCTNLVEVIQLWLWSCIWNILVIVNAIYQGKKYSVTHNYILTIQHMGFLMHALINKDFGSPKLQRAKDARSQNAKFQYR